LNSDWAVAQPLPNVEIAGDPGNCGSSARDIIPFTKGTDSDFVASISSSLASLAEDGASLALRGCADFNETEAEEILNKGTIASAAKETKTNIRIRLALEIKELGLDVGRVFMGWVSPFALKC
jgi:hypothetical protein